ncbi:Tad domain-containing protein [Gaiella sp.]|uniref:TadE/TadG family type IV pilus assembly protein n=1 Tax=Gaiella sp. TaxID=2663207 RepID=UPI002E31324E|nr:Tad domain-containing protein [Gaiella sp.]HEX5582752.1 Tad domain-containing protein [Gaiella sp.]
MLADVKRARRDERGQVLVLGAIMIPVFLLIAALVIDVGNWYTHKRQLQNRADAAAFAAGVAYSKNWKACVQTDDPALKASTAQKIADTARQYAGDPDATDYAGGTLPAGPLENTQIANQSKFDVAINSTSYDDNTDYSDGGPGPPPPGDPCFPHAGDDISPAGGQWTDVKVKERDLPSLFGGIGLPLSRNGARARIEIRPALSGNRFLPLAIPNNVITRVQVRYYNGCTDAEIVSARHDLAPLPSTDQAGFANLGGGVLWGLPATPGDLSVGDPSRGFDLDVPAYDPTLCSTPYLPIKVQVRLASRDEVDLNQDCDTLAQSKFADCFSDVSRIRVWPDGNPSAHPLIKNVTLTGGCATRADAYFGPYDGPLPSGSRTCTIGATVDVDFGNRYPGSTGFKVQVNNVGLVPPSGGSPTGVWTTNGTPIPISTTKSGNNPETGTNNINVKVLWTPATGGQKSYAEDAQQSYIGTSETAGALDLVRTSRTSFAGGLPGPAFDNVRAGGASIAVFPTIGIRSVLKTGILTTLRTGSSQGSQLVQCDPAVSSGQEFELFQNGCNPYYAKNPFVNGDWWNTTTKTCPSSTDWYSLSPSLPKYVNSSGNPWRCVLQAPGGSVGQVGDWMAAATDNCVTAANNKCQTFKTPATGANCANYDGIDKNGNGVIDPGEEGWVQHGGDSSDPRVIKVFIVPYQALKNVTGASAEIPLLGGASFYVMNWKGQQPGGAEDDPCPDPDFTSNGHIDQYSPPGQGTITGVFVENVTLESGPVDENAVCVEGQLEECRAVLVR